MRIESGQVTLNNQHQFQRSEQRSQLVQRRELPPSTASTVNTQPTPSSRTLNVSNSSLIDYSAFRIRSDQSLLNLEKISQQSLTHYDLNTNLLKALVEAMTGEKINTASSPDTSQSAEGRAANTTAISLTAEPGANETTPPPTVETTTVTLAKIQEYEYSNVDINADLTDNQGRALDINLSFTMERRYQQQDLSITITQGPLTDPLVINFDGANVKLSNNLIDFDLNADGDTDQIASLASNSAYIALDINHDGIINNGSELFGPTTGDGFAELLQYDDDGNGFIDAGDAIFSQLIAFRPSDDYQQNLNALGVGAIYTGSVNSPFSLTGSDNNLLGKVRSSGFYLTENGSAGAVQQIDLVV